MENGFRFRGDTQVEPEDNSVLGRLFLWLLGRPLVRETEEHSGGVGVFKVPPMYWRVRVAANTYVNFRYGPNAIHRGMQWLCFGFKWERLK